MELVDNFNELADDERDGLDPLEFDFGSDQFVFQVFLFVFDVFLLDVEEVEFLFQTLEALVEFLFTELVYDLGIKMEEEMVLLGL